MIEQELYQSQTQSTQLILNKTQEIICGKWRLNIIYKLINQDLRYGELRRLIPEDSEKVLIQELKALVHLGVLFKTVHAEVPPRVEYGLTEKTRTLLPLFLQLRSIGETFM